MHWYQTSLGKKYIMAVTGLAMVGFVIVHMIGNLTIFAGPGAINSYAEKLHQLVPLLWSFRLILLAFFTLHIFTGVTLYLENRNAKPVPYAYKRNIKASFPSKTMIWTGLLLGAFVIYHLLHFTFRITNPDISHMVDTSGRPDVFTMVALSFAIVPISLAYIVSMIILLLHLYHGIQSFFQSLGLNSAKTLPFIEKTGRAIACLLLVGFASIPAVFLLGLELVRK
jgi:succinate dehydrogenase / fumarate reductase cytochrome b subunit